ncbi:hypothetical protein [Crateriforma spongiae]|uniref:hypothetical protein n=1 Tax=Crateriforma spongiae TaxID=2724528 RepID=UPI0014473C65|nr:hypothetical protein [Crateriforma spongiae]
MMPSRIFDKKTMSAKVFLWGLIGSIIVGAVLGIAFVLRDSWGWFEIQVMLTTVVVAVASLCGLACDLSRTPKGLNVLPRSGMTLSILAAGLLLVGIWGEMESTEFWKTTICVVILGVATVHVCLLSIAKLARRFDWIRFIGTQVVFGFALLLCGVIIAEVDSPGVWRLIAAISIAIGAFSLSVPILHRISRLDRSTEDLTTPVETRNLAAIDEEIDRLQNRIADLRRLRESINHVESTSTELPPDAAFPQERPATEIASR